MSRHASDYAALIGPTELPYATMRNAGLPKNVSQTTRSSTPEIPWKDIAGMRDILIHQYLGFANHPYIKNSPLIWIKRPIQQITRRIRAVFWKNRFVQSGLLRSRQNRITIGIINPFGQSGMQAGIVLKQAV